VPEYMKPLAGVYALFQSYEDLLLAVALCMIRLYAAMSILPPTNDKVLQGFTRAGVAIVLAAFISFGLGVPDVLAIGPAAMFGLVVKEAFIGLLIGYAASTIFWVAECVGALIDTQTGYNSVQITNPMSGEQNTPVSGMLLQFMIVAFYMLGGMLVFVGALIESYKVWPLMSSMPSMTGSAEVFIVQQTDTLMTSIVKFAAPALLILMTIDLGIGLMTRVADKLEPNSLGQPIKAAVSMLLLSLLIGVFIAQVRHLLVPTDLMQRMNKVLPEVQRPR
jgi:type III secretion protein T